MKNASKPVQHSVLKIFIYCVLGGLVLGGLLSWIIRNVDGRYPPERPPKSYAQSFADDITYVQDHRTGLCFAIMPYKNGMSTVPCGTVQKYLIRF